MIVPKRVYTVESSGSIVKFVTCVHCGVEYVYSMKRRAKGRAEGVALIGDATTADNAKEKSQLALSKKLLKSCDAVPCPKCAMYQPEMLAKLRHVRHNWMRRWARNLLYVGAALFVVKGIRILGEMDGWLPWSAVFAVWLAVPALLVTRNLRARGFDGNQTDLARRQNIAAQRATLREEYERIAEETETAVEEERDNALDSLVAELETNEPESEEPGSGER